jgi:hypothetical protein
MPIGTTNRSVFSLLALPTAALLLALASPAQASVITVSTATASAWQLSTTVGAFETSPWPGATLPAASSFTLTPTNANTAAGYGIYSGSGVTFYRTSVLLPSFATLAVNLTAMVDNNIEIFVNGTELALYGTDLSGFGRPLFHATVANDGTTANGVASGSSFSYLASSFPTSLWNSGGSNEIEVAVRNLCCGDQGGFVLNMALTTTAATAIPEPSSGVALLAGLGLLGVLGFARRRR